MNEIEKKVYEVLHNLNWLMEGHDSSAELIKVKGNKVVLRCVGYCAECESNCIEVAFKERMPDIELIIRHSAAFKKENKKTKEPLAKVSRKSLLPSYPRRRVSRTP